MAESVSHRAHAPSRCQNCQEPLASPIGCLHCHTIFPSASNLTHFDRLGLPPRFDLSPADIERSYLAWSRELHPDFHQGQSDTDQAVSLKLSASLNDAYATIRDPFRRAEYLLKLLGGPSASEHRTMPEGFLEGVLAVRMEIEDAKESGAAAGEEGEQLLAELRSDRQRQLDNVADRLRSVEKQNEPAKPETLREIRELLNTVKYQDGLIRELTDVAAES